MVVERLYARPTQRDKVCCIAHGRPDAGNDVAVVGIVVIVVVVVVVVVDDSDWEVQRRSRRRRSMRRVRVKLTKRFGKTMKVMLERIVVDRVRCVARGRVEIKGWKPETDES